MSPSVSVSSFRKFLPVFVIIGAVWLAALTMLINDVFAYETPATCNIQLGEWQMGTPSPTAHVEGASAVVDGKIYMFTGFADWAFDPEKNMETLIVTDKVSVYDPATDTWEDRNPAPFMASHIQAGVDGQYVWLVGGFTGSHPGRATKASWRYDTVTDTWTAGPDLPQNRASGAVAIHNGRLHYMGGLPLNRIVDSDLHWTLDLRAWELDPVNTTWEEAAPLPRARNHTQGVVIEDIIYLPGGQTGHDNPEYQDRPWLDGYDTRTGEWLTGLADLPGSRSHAEMGIFAYHERLFVVGGRTENNGGWPADTVLQYNPQTNEWTQVGTLEQRLMSPTANIVGNKMIVTNGARMWNVPNQETRSIPLIDPCAAPDQAPETLADTYNYTAEFAAAQSFPSVLLNDFDPNGDPLTATLVNTVGYGLLDFQPDGTFTYTPDNSAATAGQITFSYKANDGIKESAVTLVTINIPNPAPVAVNDAYTTAYDTPLFINAQNGVLSNDSDLNNDNLQAALISQPSTGTLQFGTTGAFTYTSEANFSGDVTFSYAASDGASTSNIATVTITVNDATPTPTPTPTDDNGTVTPPPPPPTITPVPTDDGSTPTPTPVVPVPPIPVVLPQITSGTVIPVFTWPVPDDVPEWYHLVIVDSQGNVILDAWFLASAICNGQVCTITPGSDVLPYGLVNGDYTWAMQAWDNGGFSDYTTPETFTIAVPPPAQPVPRGVDVATGRPILTIDDDPNVSWVNVWVGTPAWETISLQWYRKSADSCNGEVCVIVLDAHPTNGSYLLYLRTWGPAGFVNNDPNFWVGPLSFSVSFPPPSPVTNLTMTLQDQNNLSPVFTWEGAAGTTWYELWIGTDAPEYQNAHMQWYSAVEMGCGGGGLCTVRPQVALVPGETYIWYVLAWGPGGFSTGGDYEGWRSGSTFVP